MTDVGSEGRRLRSVRQSAIVGFIALAIGFAASMPTASATGEQVHCSARQVATVPIVINAQCSFTISCVGVAQCIFDATLSVNALGQPVGAMSFSGGSQGDLVCSGPAGCVTRGLAFLSPGSIVTVMCEGGGVAVSMDVSCSTVRRSA